MSSKGCLAAFALVLVSAALLALLSLTSLGRFLDVSQDLAEAAPVDAIVVMGGEGGRFMRTEHALELYERGLAPVVVFSGGTLLASGLACSSTEMSLDAAKALGLPADAVVVSGAAQSTYEEARNLAQLADDHDWESMALVTDRFHTRRSLRTFQTAMPQHSIVATAPYDERFDAARWWGNEHSLVFAINEALKLGFYWRAYGIRPFG